MLDYIRDLEYVAFDIETNGLAEHKILTIGIAVSGHFDSGYYAAFYDWSPITKSLVRLITEEEERTFVKKLCAALIGKKLIMHNALFDVTTIRHQYKENLTDLVYCDTLLLKHTLSEERPFGLKDIAVLYKEEIGIPAEDVANQEQLELAESVKRNGGKFNNSDKEVWKGSVDIIGKYACGDTDLCLRVFDYFEEQLFKQKLDKFFYEQEVMPLFREATTQMKFNGLFVDVPYFEKLKSELIQESKDLETAIFEDIKDDIEAFVRKHVDKEVNISRTGRFAVELLAHYGLAAPINSKTGKATVAKAKLLALKEEYPNHKALNWLTYEHIMAAPFELDAEGKVVKTKPIRVYGVDPDEPELDEEVVFEIKKKIYLDTNPENPMIFNLASNHHLGWLIFNRYNCEPEELSRKTKKPKLDADNLVKYDHLPFIKKLLDMKKLDKTISTYVSPILEMHTNGWLYPSMLAYGTTSGRYSCAGGLNLQTLPRDDKRIKKGFIAPPGYRIVNADFAGLEPRIFSWTSRDPGLKEVWRKGLDLYSQIAIDVFGLKDVSSDPKAPNFLKKVNPKMRDKVKVFALATPYGASHWQIAKLMKIEPDEAFEIVENYLNSYPELKRYMADCERAAQRTGRVQAPFGRVRHLAAAKELHRKYGTRIKDKRAMVAAAGDALGPELYYRNKGLLNNAKNFPIQSTAASVCNAAMIKLSKLFKKNKIDGWIALSVHDEVTCIVKEDQVKFAAELLQDSMQNNEITQQIDIPILAEPIIAANLADAK